jgi:L-arabinonolactonase
MRMERISEAGVSRLGESPLWSVREQKLYWVDIDGHKLLRFDPNNRQYDSWDVSEQCCAPAERREGGLLLALARRLIFFEPDSGKTTPCLDVPTSEPSKNRLNDATIDSAGRFWVGSMSPHGEPASATLYRFERPTGFTGVISPFFTINGLAFSPDGKTMYVSDTREPVRSIWQLDYDVASGTPSNRRLFVDTTNMAGRPDGGACDQEGYYWMAGFGGGELARFTPSGRHDRTIKLPIKNVTKLAFGGPNLDIIYATTAQQKDGEEDPAFPSGSLLAIHDAGYRGVPLPAFDG